MRAAKLSAAGAAILGLLSTPASPHDFWSNGEAVPPWVKTWCCGPTDVHRLEPRAVHIMADGYHIDGLSVVIPMSRAMPSPDGQYWAFFDASAPEPFVFCFYAPLNGARANDRSGTHG